MSTPTSRPPAGAVTPPGFDPGFLGVAAPLPAVGNHPVVELTYTHFTV